MMGFDNSFVSYYKLGYIPNNIIVISQKANRIKTDASMEEILKVWTFYNGLEQTKATIN